MNRLAPLPYTNLPVRPELIAAAAIYGDATAFP